MEDIRERVKKSRAAQGLPPTIEDPAMLARVAAMMSTPAGRAYAEAADQGLPDKVEDPATLARVAAMLMHTKHVVDEAPPLSEEQRAKLRGLLAHDPELPPVEVTPNVARLRELQDGA